MSDGADSEGRNKRHLAKPAAGALGTLGVVLSIWWFALRPRRKRRRES
ncbi:MAG: hypothetical protein ACLP6E_15305 [Acidimicrobiales bacterium]